MFLILLVLFCVGMLEILPYGASKGKGVLKLLEHCKILPQETMVLGDGENDKEMFELCGISVAVDNAKELLKNVATVVTKSNDENGVAYALNLMLQAYNLD